MNYLVFTCKCGHETNSYENLNFPDDFECPSCMDKRLGKKKILTVKVDTKTIHFEFRGIEEGKSKAARGVERIYEQFRVK